MSDNTNINTNSVTDDIISVITTSDSIHVNQSNELTVDTLKLELAKVEALLARHQQALAQAEAKANETRTLLALRRAEVLAKTQRLG